MYCTFFFFCYGIITGYICLRLKNNACLLSFRKVGSDMQGKFIAAHKLLLVVSPEPHNCNAKKKHNKGMISIITLLPSNQHV